MINKKQKDLIDPQTFDKQPRTWEELDNILLEMDNAVDAFIIPILKQIDDYEKEQTERLTVLRGPRLIGSRRLDKELNP